MSNRNRNLTVEDKARREKAARRLQTVFWIGLGFLIVLTVLGVFQNDPGPLTLAGLFVVILVVLLISLGLSATYRAYGALVDSRNKASLSRLQVTLWTIITLSAFLALALPRSLPEALYTHVSVEAFEGLDAEDPERAELCFQNEEPAYAVAEGCQELVDDEVDLSRYMASEAFDEAVGRQLRENPELAEECFLDEEEPMLEVAEDCRDPLRVAFPSELIAALGISTASLAGSSLIKGSKKSQVVRKEDVKTEQKQKLAILRETHDSKKKVYNDLNNQFSGASTRLNELKTKVDGGQPLTDEESTEKEMLEGVVSDLGPKVAKASQEAEGARKELEDAESGVAVEETLVQGVLKVNERPEQATLGDMFRGDEASSYERVDLSKVQMFLFTVAIILSYSVALYTLLKGDAWRNPLGVDFPAFSASLVTLLGISHAGYLSIKATNGS